jgi:phospho-N-acetylmuramoyl-pentapeptide-transferase
MGMKAIIFGALAAFVTAALIGKPAIRELHHLKFGQKILEDGPTWHQGKQNTPTMGGVIFILAILVPILICLPAMIGAGSTARCSCCCCPSSSAPSDSSTTSPPSKRSATRA